MLNLSVNVFSKMKKLRLLRVLCLSNCDDLKYLSNELRFLDWTGYPLKSLPSSFQPDNLITLLLPYSRIEQLWKGNRVSQRRRMNSIAPMLPSLSCLRSLTKLKLRDCNLGEGDISGTISCLSSLTYLELNGNNFNRIPASLTGLSKLEELNLSRCGLCNMGEEDIPSDISGLSSLRVLDLHGNNFTSIAASLARLSNLQRLGVCNCSELESLPVLLARNTSGWKHNRSYFIAINSYRLAENMSAITLLKTHIKAFENSRKRLDVVIPGNEIPEWFSQQRDGSVIEIPLPFNIQNDRQWIGVAVCCIFGDDDGSEIKVIGGPAYIHSTYSGQSSSDGSVFQVKNSRRVDFNFIDFDGRPITKDHLLLRYFSREVFYPLSLRDNFETKNLSLEMSFQSSKRYPSVNVKKCGVRIMYEKDLEDIEEVQCHTTQSSPNFEHIHHQSTENDGSAGSTSFVKRKRDID
ncbi:hypothetical protein Gotur_027152, partial [Gossypium turneri]